MLALIVLIVIPAPNSNVVPCRFTFVSYRYQAMRYVWAHMSHIKMKRLICAVEAGFLAWIFSYLLRGHDSPSESCCVLVNSLLFVLVCACCYAGFSYTLSSRVLPFG